MQKWVKFCKFSKYKFQTDSIVVFLNLQNFTNSSFNLGLVLKKIINVNLFLVPPIIDCDREFKIVDYHILNLENAKIELFFENKINNKLFDTKLLQNSYFLISKKEYKFIFSEISSNFIKSELIGYEVFDEIYGSIGTVTDIFSNGFHEILVVYNSQNKEILIPFVDDFILKIELNIISMSLPNGLIDLNK